MRRAILILFVSLLLLTSCTGNEQGTITYEDLPETGDTVRGEELFHESVNRTPSCVSCHNTESSASPDLAGLGAIAGTREAGVGAREYTFYSIIDPARFIVAGYGNAMYDLYDERLSLQDVADLIAYLLTL